MKVSILTITYNHVDFISQMLDSVLSQKVNFDYEIIVGDDFSTDGTREVLLKYKQLFPDQIKLLLHDHNLGKSGKINFITTLKACKGEYIALLDGDDYWTNPLKLQKQIDFMDSNPDYAVCGHPVDILSNNILQSPVKTIHSECLTIEDLAKTNFLYTPSVVYRNGLIEHLPSWFEMAAAGDYVLHMLNAKKGKIKYLPDTMAVYRQHAGGVWSSRSIAEVSEKWLHVLSFLLTEDFDEKVIGLLTIQKRDIAFQYLIA